MTSLNMALGLSATRGKVFVAKAGKTTGGSRGSVKEEKGLIEFLIGSMQKEDQLLETDPVLKKMEDSKPGPNSVSIPPKKKPGGFGGLFAKN